MANFTFTGGTQTIGSTEFSIAQNANYSSATPRTTLGYVSVLIDANTLAAGDEFRLTAYEKANGGTQRPVMTATLLGAQSEIFMVHLGLLGEGWDATLKKITGTDRSILFSVRQDTNDVNVVTISDNAITATAIANDSLTAAKIATDAIDSDAIAASAVTELQTGLATSSALTTAQADLTTLTGRLTSGRATNLDNLDIAVSALGSLISAVPAAVMASVIETGAAITGGTLNLTGALRILVSSAASKVSGFLSNAPRYRNVGDTKDRITGTTSTDGRTAVTVDPT